MRKKGLLALLLAVTLLMSGCALVTVDEAADNARVIVDVNGETVNKLTVHNAVHSVIEQNEYMNQFYAMLGGNVNLPTDEATVLTQVVDTYVYRAYANTHNLGMSSAAGFLQSAVGMLCILAANAVVRRLDPDSSLF